MMKPLLMKFPQKKLNLKLFNPITSMPLLISAPRYSQLNLVPPVDPTRMVTFIIFTSFYAFLLVLSRSSSASETILLWLLPTHNLQLTTSSAESRPLPIWLLHSHPVHVREFSKSWMILIAIIIICTLLKRLTCYINHR